MAAAPPPLSAAAWNQPSMWPSSVTYCDAPTGGRRTPTTLWATAGTIEPIARSRTVLPTMSSGTTDTTAGMVLFSFKA